jgi:ribonuclease P protein component
MKRTFQPSNLVRARRHGFRLRMSTAAGRIANRDMRGYSIIKKRSDFLAANRGKRYATPGFVLLVRDRQDDDPAKRLGITITKKVGNAVVRNRMRRRFRELAREMLGEKGKAGADHVLIGRDGGIERDFGELRADMARALMKLCNSSPLGEELA